MDALWTLRGKRYRKRKDKFKNITLDFMVYERGQERETVVLNVEGSDPNPKFDLKKQANKLVKRLAKEGAFNGFFKTSDIKNAEIHGKLPRDYQVDFIVPPAVGGSYSADNLYVTSKDVADLMYNLYWHQILMEVSSFRYKDDPHKFSVVFPKMPRFFSNKDFLDMVLPHERHILSEYFNRKAARRREAYQKIARTDKKRYLILEMNKKTRPPKGMKMAYVKVHAVPFDERARIKQEYLRSRENIVRQSLARGDFNGLSETDIWVIAKSGHVPDRTGLTCHHVIPRAVGGQNDMDNIIWLDKDVHFGLHKNYINLLVTYFDDLLGEKRPVFFEMPVPEDTKLPLYVKTRRGIIVPQALKKLAKSRKRAQKTL